MLRNVKTKFLKNTYLRKLKDLRAFFVTKLNQNSVLKMAVCHKQKILSTTARGCDSVRWLWKTLKKFVEMLWNQ